MKKFQLMAIFSVLFMCVAPLYSYLDITAGPEMQVNVSSAKNMIYSYALSATVLYGVEMPFLAGVKYTYQDTLQRLAVLGVVRLAPEDSWIKLDCIIGGGISTLGTDQTKLYPLFMAGITPKVFVGEELGGAYIYVSGAYMGITANNTSYSFVNVGGGVGIYF